jgi:hypothetical protein
LLRDDPNIPIPGQESRRNGIFKCGEDLINKIYSYLFKTASHIIVETSKNGSPQKVDMQLQYQYYKEIYGITDKKEVEKSVFDKICPDDSKEEHYTQV